MYHVSTTLTEEEGKILDEVIKSKLYGKSRWMVIRYIIKDWLRKFRKENDQTKRS